VVALNRRKHWIRRSGKGPNFTRPVLIVKKFSKYLFLGLPLSTKLKDNIYYYPITLKGNTVSVLISQLRTFSSKRILNKIGELDSKDYQSVLKHLKKVLFLSSSLAKQKGSRG
jgi:mRNA interferase MazF